MVKVSQYETHDGDIPFATWLNELGARAAAKGAVARMEVGNFGDNKQIQRRTGKKEK